MLFFLQFFSISMAFEHFECGATITIYTVVDNNNSSYRQHFNVAENTAKHCHVRRTQRNIYVNLLIFPIFVVVVVTNERKTSVFSSNKSDISFYSTTTTMNAKKWKLFDLIQFSACNMCVLLHVQTTHENSQVSPMDFVVVVISSNLLCSTYMQHLKLNPNDANFIVIS